ncbi:thiosulfate/3-mercaptopyruvate sulfurtransferase [Actinocorallia herbida]|uniref:Thiosulfate/3-mercaptopyruvate sulfurtransferase n=1 Tax=Actinocorallia herbida TaxID=58109 RepID=A0A3N1CXH6_9ACTN|nr:rhodanese-like domain-containing protein [Actinocorallia herbida]ROO85428.1 thiosulfate/3-mercaptopyruvate sulfurtransferase [Actinocorallia herbida]
MQALISAAELAATTDALVLDVTVQLAAPEFDGDYRSESGRGLWLDRHIPGSAHVDLRTVFADPAASYHFGKPSPAQVAAELAALGAVPGTPVVLYDAGSMQWASRAWWTLRDAGFDARILDGGLPAWQGPFASGEEPARSAGHLPDPGESRGLWADRAEVEAISLGKVPDELVCALGPEYLAGTVPTRYTRRGHIPGSLSLPAKSLIGPEGTVLSGEALSSALRPVEGRLDEPIVVYCGGGVSACLTALGLVLGGYSDVRVYDGSLDEWSADPSLPLVFS